MHVCPEALEAACNGYRDPGQRAKCNYELVRSLREIETLCLIHLKKIAEIYGQEISPLPGEQVLYGQDGQDLLLRLGSMPQEGGEAATEARYKKSSYVVLVIVLERTTILHVLLYDISSTKGTVQNDVAY